MLALFWEVAVFRRGPEHMPVSAAWLVAAMVMQAAMALLVQGMLPALPVKPGTEDHTLGLLVIDVAMTLLWGWAVLRIASRPERFVQTLTAIFGCQLIFQPMVLPASWLAASAPEGSAWDVPAGLLFTALSVWALIAMARILRSATDWPLFGCALLVIVQAAATVLVSVAVFPDILEALKAQAA